MTQTNNTAPVDFKVNGKQGNGGKKTIPRETNQTLFECLQDISSDLKKNGPLTNFKKTSRDTVHAYVGDQRFKITCKICSRDSEVKEKQASWDMTISSIQRDQHLDFSVRKDSKKNVKEERTETVSSDGEKNKSEAMFKAKLGDVNTMNQVGFQQHQSNTSASSALLPQTPPAPQTSRAPQTPHASQTSQDMRHTSEASPTASRLHTRDDTGSQSTVTANLSQNNNTSTSIKRPRSEISASSSGINSKASNNKLDNEKMSSMTMNVKNTKQEIQDIERDCYSVVDIYPLEKALNATDYQIRSLEYQIELQKRKKKCLTDIREKLKTVIENKKTSELQQLEELSGTLVHDFEEEINEIL